MKEPKKDSRAASQTPVKLVDDGKGGSEWRERERPVRRTFPGPRGQGMILRVAFDREVFADLIGHTQAHLDTEVCGVLAGDVCEDDEGAFIHVTAIVRGAAARQGSAHVTFTHETWNLIHETLEREHPQKRVIGWYHSHPGFGVEFSEMDSFIQRNFFASPTQVAVVFDPLCGDVALCRSAGESIDYIDRFWVDGREHQARVPRSARAVATTIKGEAISDPDQLQNLQRRIAELSHAIDEQRLLFQRFVMSVLVAVCLGIVSVAGYMIYNSSRGRFEPPKTLGHQAIPVVVNDKVMFVEIGWVGWTPPADVGDVYKQLQEQLRSAEERARAQGLMPLMPGSAPPIVPQSTPPK